MPVLARCILLVAVLIGTSPPAVRAYLEGDCDCAGCPCCPAADIATSGVSLCKDDLSGGSLLCVDAYWFAGDFGIEQDDGPVCIPCGSEPYQPCCGQDQGSSSGVEPFCTDPALECTDPLGSGELECTPAESAGSVYGGTYGEYGNV